MRRRWIALGAIGLVFWLLVTSGVALAVAEWRDDQSDDRCQAAVAFFNAIHSFMESPESIGVAGALLDDPATLDDEWDAAFTNMREQCLSN